MQSKVCYCENEFISLFYPSQRQGIIVIYFYESIWLKNTFLTPSAASTFSKLLLLESAIPPWGEFSVAERYRRNWKYDQSIVNQIWKRWVKGYLVDLQSRSKWNLTERDLKYGNLVLVTDQDSPKSSLPLALVNEVKLREDSHLHSATVKTKNSTLVRPVTKLVLLEESEQYVKAP